LIPSQSSLQACERDRLHLLAQPRRILSGFNFNGSLLEAEQIRQQSLSLPGAGLKKPKLKLEDLLFGARGRRWLWLTARCPEQQAVGYRPTPPSFNYHKRLARAIQVHRGQFEVTQED